MFHFLLCDLSLPDFCHRPVHERDSGRPWWGKRLGRDAVDGDLTNKIVETGTLDTNTPNLYTLTYTATDQAGTSLTIDAAYVRDKVAALAKNTDLSKFIL